MLTRIHVRNFKRFGDVDIELGGNTVFIGPNDSGKTSALQALALWELGLRRWREKHGGEQAPEQRPGATINRRDLISMPVPHAQLLWRDLHTRSTSREHGKQRTENVRIEIVVEGVTDGHTWKCGLEFDYANSESLYCRPLRLEEGERPSRMPVPNAAFDVRVAFLPPMSGLATEEPKWEPGRIGVLLGEGQTAQVLRNLCYQVSESGDDAWGQLHDHIERLFGVRLLRPEYIAERGVITMSFRTPGGVELDLSSAGRGCQQTLLVLAHLLANPGTVLLIDEPDAHLEVLRQRQIYQTLTEVAAAHGSQIIVASHSEVLLNEAADRDTLVAFIGQRPHRIDDRGAQAVRALKEIGFDQYYQAEQTGWVLYLEGSTDLAILRVFADTLAHVASGALGRPFVHYVGNQPQAAKRHFFGLREAKSDLVAVGLFDRDVATDALDSGTEALRLMRWGRREIENYLCTEANLLRYARQGVGEDLFADAQARANEAAMAAAIASLTSALAALRRPSPWSPDIKATDDFLDPLFEDYFSRLGLPNLMRKTNYHRLAELMPAEEIDPEVSQKLHAIAEVAGSARAAGLPGGVI